MRASLAAAVRHDGADAKRERRKRSNVIELEKLLAEVGSQPPCGANLEYDADFQALEAAARGKPEQELGDQRTAAVPPDWDDVKRRAEVLFTRTKDLRVAILLARALVRLTGLPGLAQSLQLVRALLDRYWQNIHPELDPDDQDPTMRLNALVALADPEGMLRDVRQALVVPAVKQGRVTVREVLIASGRASPAEGEAARSLTEVEGILRQAAIDHPAAMEAATASVRDIGAISVLVTEKVGGERTIDLGPLRNLLAPVAAVCDRVLGVESPAAAPATGESAGTGQATVAVPATGEIRSRDDAIRLLERICEFMERTEPANPAPLLIRRAQRLISKSFLEIIAELAPDSLATIQSVAGIKNEG